MACPMESRITEVNPDSRPGPLSQLFRHERDLGVFLFQVFVNDSGFVDDCISVNEDGHLLIWVEPEEILGFVFKINLDQLIRDLFFR